LSGERFYIDVWVTWCGPCKEEFKNSSKLYESLKSKDITVIYLSIDNDNREDKWKDIVNFYGLKGNHIRADKKLISDLQNLLGSQTMAIPIHIISNENGNITKKNYLMLLK
jgi:alkyl hydroperoxide reductase subunit AhpC